jgi:hypothetical protein
MMTMPTIIESLEHLSRDYPVEDSHLVVAVAGHTQALFEVTDVTRQGKSVVLECHPVETPTDLEAASSGAESDSSLYKNEEVSFLSAHDPLRFYEDLR